uniref:WD repeat-containing protein 55 homolog n=1 Tax=Glossina pallidipes TaxID=7398 RepID=A0A1A9ZW07_GLOPL
MRGVEDPATDNRYGGASITTSPLTEIKIFVTSCFFTVLFLFMQNLFSSLVNGYKYFIFYGYKYVASRGNDNLVNVRTAVNESGISTVNEALRVLNQHQPNILASGGGTADRCIKFWNFNNGSLLTSIDTKSQVCGLLWSRTYKELISAEDLANNQLTIWKYPSKVKQTELGGRTSRVLQLALSLDGSTVISAAADETLLTVLLNVFMQGITFGIKIVSLRTFVFPT